MLHIAGTSCVAFAANGSQKGVRDASILPFLAWVAQRLLLQEPLILHENSPRFQVQLLHRFLGHLYHIDDTNVESLKYGGAVRRERKLTRMVHKFEATILTNPGFESFDKRFHRDCHMHWKAYYWQHLVDDARAKAC